MLFGLILLLVLVLLICVGPSPDRRERFDDVPEPVRQQRANDISKNLSMFGTNVKYTDVRKSMPWMDPVTYTSVRNLYLSGNHVNRADILAAI